MKGSDAAAMALSGVTAALAVVIMSLGGLISVATYVCPMVCALLLHLVLRRFGKRVAWAWYMAVALLSALLGPDKEAAAIFAVLGYYPIVKPALDRTRLAPLWKLLLFNGAILLLYYGMIQVLGVAELAAEFQELGWWMAAVLLVLGNITFFLLDRLLALLERKYGK